MAKAYQERLIALIKDTVTLLCKNGLEYNQEFCVEGLLGVTLDKDEVFLIPIKELVNDKGVGTTDMTEDGLDTSQAEADVSAPPGMSPKRERKKKRRHAESTALQQEDGGYEGGDGVGGGGWENADSKNRSMDGGAENDSYDKDDQQQQQQHHHQQQLGQPPSSKRRQQDEIKTELSKVKAEDIVVIKEEVDDEEFVSAFQDSSMDSSNLNRTEQGAGDSSAGGMAYYSQPGTSQGGAGPMAFSMDQLAEHSALSAAGMAGLPPGSEADPSTWLQQSSANMQTSQGEWQGQKHQAVCGYCGKNLAGRCELQRHINSVHLKLRSSCKTCGKSFSCPTALRRHVRTKHENAVSERLSTSPQEVLPDNAINLQCLGKEFAACGSNFEAA